MAEKGTRPDSYPEWATSVDASDISEPPTAQKESGWTGGIPPHQWFNWLQKKTDEQLKYIDEGRPRTFTNVGSACSALSDGEFGLVFDLDPTKQPLAKTAITGLTNSTELDSCITGRWLLIATDTRVQVVDMADGSVAQDASLSSQLCIACDGNQVYIGTTTNLQAFAFDADTGLIDFAGGAEWTYAHGADVFAVECDGKYVYFGGEVSSSKTHGRIEAYGGSAGSADWTANHTATIRAIALTHNAVAFVGDDEASGDTIEGRIHPLDSATPRQTIECSAAEFNAYSAAWRDNMLAIAGELPSSGFGALYVVPVEGSIVGGDGGDTPYFSAIFSPSDQMTGLCWVGDHLIIGHDDGANSGIVEVIRIEGSHDDTFGGSDRDSKYGELRRLTTAAKRLHFDGQRVWCTGDDGTNNACWLYWPSPSQIVKRIEVAEDTQYYGEHSVRCFAPGRQS